MRRELGIEDNALRAVAATTPQLQWAFLLVGSLQEWWHRTNAAAGVDFARVCTVAALRLVCPTAGGGVGR